MTTTVAMDIHTQTRTLLRKGLTPHTVEMSLLTWRLFAEELLLDPDGPLPYAINGIPVVLFDDDIVAWVNVRPLELP